MAKNFLTMTDTERKHYLQEHFMYEVRMLFFSIKKYIFLSQRIAAGEGGYIEDCNMAAECFLLHAKTLLEFFYNFKKGPHSIYMRAWHFYGNLGSYKKILPSKTVAIKSVEQRVHSEVSHMGASRIDGTPQGKVWNMTNILHDFMNVVEVFINNLPIQYYSEDLRNY